MQLCPLKLFYIVYNPSRLRHFVPDKSSLSYITYRRLIKKHRRRHLKRVSHDQEEKDQCVPAVPSESAVVLTDQRDRLRSVAEDSFPTAVSTDVTSSSSVKDRPPVNSCTAVVSRCSFSITRLLSLSEDGSSGEEAKTGPDAGDDVRKLSTSLSAAGHTPAETVASQDRNAAAGSLEDSGSVRCAEVKPVPVHFKKRMLNTATVSQPPSRVPEPAVIGKSLTPRRSVTIYEDHHTPTTSTPPAKVGIVISHGRAMTLQDKLQMTTNSARRSPTSSGRLSVAESVASPLQVVNRQSTPLGPHCKLKRRQKPVVKRSLIPPSKVTFFYSSSGAW